MIRQFGEKLHFHLAESAFGSLAKNDLAKSKYAAMESGSSTSIKNNFKSSLTQDFWII